jgi:hypothetical protein
VTDFSKFSSFYLSNEKKIILVSYNRRCHSYNHCFSSQYTHELSALEPEGHGDESAEEVLNEIITGRKAISLNNAIYEISPGVGLEPRSHSYAIFDISSRKWNHI